MEKLAKVFSFVFVILLMVAGIADIILTFPILKVITSYGYNNKLIFAGLWALLLFFIWIVGCCVFFLGLLMLKYMIDITDNNTEKDSINDTNSKNKNYNIFYEDDDI